MTAAAPLTRAEAEARIAELDRMIANYPSWGAALSIMDEERRGLRRYLATLAAEEATAAKIPMEMIETAKSIVASNMQTSSTIIAIAHALAAQAEETRRECEAEVTRFKAEQTAVTDDMVNSALRMWYQNEWPDDPVFASDAFRERAMSEMRASLEAALKARLG